MSNPLPPIPPQWADFIRDQVPSAACETLGAFLAAEERAGKTIFPKRDEYFRALELTPPDQLRVIILGQDPYHGDGQAHGLSFSVRRGVKIPPSLRNIYKELERDIGMQTPNHGCLESWSRQGVLLLNSVLSVERSNAASHQGRGWEQLTDAIIRAVDERAKPCVFMLWGSHAQRKADIIQNDRHCVLTAPHPSPLSAHRGFIGCGHFSKANDFLAAHGRQTIQWERLLSDDVGIDADGGLPLFSAVS